jgi:hypothetical protein
MSESVVRQRCDQGVDLVIDLTQPTLHVPGFVGEHYELDGTHEVTVFGPHDRIVADLIDIEVAQLVALGDRPQDARDWLVDRSGAAWMTLFETGVVQDAEHVLGLVRVTVGSRANRSLKDLAVLVGADEAVLISAVRSSFGFPQDDDDSALGLIDVTTLDLTPRGVSNRINTLSNLERLARAALISIVRATQTDDAEVVVSLQNPIVARQLRRLGWPLFDLGFGEMSYRLFADHLTPMPTVFTWGYAADAGPRLDLGSTEHFAKARVALLGSGQSTKVPAAFADRRDVASAITAEHLRWLTPDLAG